LRLETAQAYAAELIDFMRPYCERIEVAGGIRRGKLEPHDIEIVAKPKFEDANEGWFQPTYYNALDHKLEGVLHDGGWDLVHLLGYGDPDKAGRKAPYGPKYKRLKYRSEKLDLFSVIPPAEWGVIFTIRTGDADYSHWLVQQGWKNGIKVEDGRLITKDAYLKSPEEADVFRILNVPMVEPRFRDYRATRAEPIPTDPLYATPKSSREVPQP
jgi:DNA polymerase/3'-5' exonuclease PolX